MNLQNCNAKSDWEQVPQSSEDPELPLLEETSTPEEERPFDFREMRGLQLGLLGILLDD